MNGGLFHVPDMDEDDEDVQDFVPAGEELPEFEDDFIPGHSEGIITEEMGEILKEALDIDADDTTIDNGDAFLKSQKTSAVSAKTNKKLPICYMCALRHDFGECLLNEEEE